MTAAHRRRASIGLSRRTPLTTVLRDAVSLFVTGFGYAGTVVGVPLALGVIALRRLTGFSPRLDRVIRFTSAMLPALFGIVGRVHGSRNVGPSTDQPYLVVANHVNIFDGFLLRGYLPASLPLRGIELESHFTWPVYGTATRLYGNVPIPHNAPRVALGRLNRARLLLESGISLVVLPEGHRTRDGRLQRFMIGPFRLAKAAGVGILPVALCTSYRLKRVGSLRIRPGTAALRIGAPISPESVAALGERELRDHMRGRIASLMTQEP